LVDRVKALSARFRPKHSDLFREKIQMFSEETFRYFWRKYSDVFRGIFTYFLRIYSGSSEDNAGLSLDAVGLQ